MLPPHYPHRSYPRVGYCITTRWNQGEKAGKTVFIRDTPGWLDRAVVSLIYLSGGFNSGRFLTPDEAQILTSCEWLQEEPNNPYLLAAILDGANTLTMSGSPDLPLAYGWFTSSHPTGGFDLDLSRSFDFYAELRNMAAGSDLSTSVACLNLSTRACNLLRSMNVSTVADLVRVQFGRDKARYLFGRDDSLRTYYRVGESVWYELIRIVRRAFLPTSLGGLGPLTLNDGVA